MLSRRVHTGVVHICALSPSAILVVRLLKDIEASSDRRKIFNRELSRSNYSCFSPDKERDGDKHNVPLRRSMVSWMLQGESVIRGCIRRRLFKAC
jgi:hypothetical protein